MLGKTYESLKSSIVCDDISIITAEIVRINNRVGAFAGDIVHVGLQSLRVCLIDGPTHAEGNDAFHHYGNSLLISQSSLLEIKKDLWNMFKPLSTRVSIVDLEVMSVNTEHDSKCKNTYISGHV